MVKSGALKLGTTGNVIGSVTEGISTRTPTHSVVAAGNGVSADILAANTSRKAALFINDSDTVIYLGVEGNAAVANDGIRLNANGGSYYISSENGNLTTPKVTGISSAASKNVLVTEWV